MQRVKTFPTDYQGFEEIARGSEFQLRNTKMSAERHDGVWIALSYATPIAFFFPGFTLYNMSNMSSTTSSHQSELRSWGRPKKSVQSSLGQLLLAPANGNLDGFDADGLLLQEEVHKPLGYTRVHLSPIYDKFVRGFYRYLGYGYNSSDVVRFPALPGPIALPGEGASVYVGTRGAYLPSGAEYDNSFTYSHGSFKRILAAADVAEVFGLLYSRAPVNTGRKRALERLAAYEKVAGLIDMGLSPAEATEIAEESLR